MWLQTKQTKEKQNPIKPKGNDLQGQSKSHLGLNSYYSLTLKKFTKLLLVASGDRMLQGRVFSGGASIFGSYDNCIINDIIVIISNLN